MPFYKSDNTNRVPPKNGCNSCMKPIADLQSYLKCDNNTCNKEYHPGCKSIFGVHISRVAAQNTWFCSDKCGKNAPTTPVSSPSKSIDLDENKNSSIQKIEKMFEHLSKQNDGIVESQHFLNKQFEELKKTNEQLVKQINNLQEEVNFCKTQMSKHQAIINKLEADIDCEKQKQLQNDVVMAGCPSEALRDPKIFVTGVMKLLDLDITDDVIDIHAIKPKPNQNMQSSSNQQSNDQSGMIIIKFKTIESKEQLMSKKRARRTIFIKEIGGYDVPAHNQLYIRDQMTQLKQALFREARVIRNTYNFTYLWYKDGGIFLRKTDKSKVLPIANWNDLNHIKPKLEHQNNTYGIKNK